MTSFSMYGRGARPWNSLPHSPPMLRERSTSVMSRSMASPASSRCIRSAPATLTPGIVHGAYPPNRPCGVWIFELSAMAIMNTIGTWCATHSWAVPTPPRCLPCPAESFQCDEMGMNSGNSFSTSSTSGARPAGHHGKPNAFMPSISGSAPCPSVLIEYASMSANGELHWDMPASTIALPPLPCEAPACRQCSVENTALAKQLCTALITPVAIMTELLVAARTSGYRHEPGSNLKSIGANVALLIGRSWNRYSYT